MKRFRRGLVLKAHAFLYHSTLGLGVTKKKKVLEYRLRKGQVVTAAQHSTDPIESNKEEERWWAHRAVPDLKVV